MPVNLVSSPDTHALTKGGRMTYQFSGSGRLATAGTRSQSGLLISGPVADGTKLTLRWNGKVVPIVARTAPELANEFPAGDGSSAHVDAILLFFQQYFPLRDDFTVERAPDFGSLKGITLTARQPGSAYDMALTSAPGLEITRHLDGASPIIRPQYSVYVELWLENTERTTFERVFAAPIETDSAGLARFDAGDILHSELRSDYPAWNYPQPYGGVNSSRRYYVAYGEAFGTPLQVGKVIQDDTYHAYLGGADYEHRAGNGFELATFVQTGAAANGDRALRFGSKTRYVRFDEPQFLTFLNTRASVSGILLDVYLKFSDNSVLDLTGKYAPQVFAAGEKLTFAVGPKQLDLAGDIPAGKTLVEYYVKLKTTDADYSTQYRFVLNARYEPYVRYFGYLNSLGCLDTCATFGKGSGELNRFYETAERFMPTGYDVAQGQFLHYDQSLQPGEEVTTGYRSQLELRGWDDFYRAPERFRLLVGATTMKALPIAVTSKSIKLSKDGDTLFAHKFDYQYLFKNDFYTADESDELLGDGYPPPGFEPGGSVEIVQPTIVNARDETIDDAVRALDSVEINKFKQAYAWGNHALAGYLKQADADQLYQTPYVPAPAAVVPNLLVYNPTTKKNETATSLQVAEYAGGLKGILEADNEADQDIRLKPDANLRVGVVNDKQTGTYYVSSVSGDIRAFIGYRADRTLQFFDVLNQVSVTTTYNHLLHNGYKIYHEGYKPRLSLDEVLAVDPVSERVVVAGQFVRTNAGTPITNPSGLVGISPNSPDRHAYEPMTDAAVRSFLQTVRVLIATAASGDQVEVRQNPDGSRDLVAVKGGLHQVLLRGNVSTLAMEIFGIVRPGVTLVPSLDGGSLFAAWYNNGAGKYNLEAFGPEVLVKEVIKQLRRSEEQAAELGQVLKTTINPDDNELVYIVGEIVHCRDLENPREFTLEDAVNGLPHNTPIDIPYPDYKKIGIDIVLANGKKTSRVGYDIESTPGKIILDLPADLTPFMGRIYLTYKNG